MASDNAWPEAASYTGTGELASTHSEEVSSTYVENITHTHTHLLGFLIEEGTQNQVTCWPSRGPRFFVELPTTVKPNGHEPEQRLTP